LNDRQFFFIPEELPIYKQAHYLQTDLLPNQEQSTQYLTQFTNIQEFVTSEFVQHFYACCRAVLIQSTLNNTTTNSSSSGNTRDNNNTMKTAIQRNGGPTSHNLTCSDVVYRTIGTN